jgi:hypothetical protein
MNKKSLHVAAPGNERYFIELFSGRCLRGCGRIKTLNIGYLTEPYWREVPFVCFWNDTENCSR